MDKIDFGSRHRTTRWYEWVLLLVLLSLVFGVRAESVYKCTDADADITYQAQACAPSQQEMEIAMPAAPAHVVAPDYGVDKKRIEKKPAVNSRREPASKHAIAQDKSYECRVSNGDVFYRHTPCPHSIAGDGNVHNGKNRGRSSGALTVSSRQVSREEACAQIHRPGAIGRSGREHDEDVSTYERNLGNDPCR